MNPITLNLVAIAIFLTTLLSLLGPMVHITPEMLGIAVAGLAGLILIDRFGWQGLGGTLLIDWLAQQSPEYRQRIVQHEAGHFLAAHLLEIPVTAYHLSAWDAMRAGVPGSGGVQFDASDIEAEVEQGQLSAQQLDRYCTVWMAGIAAEELLYGTAQGGSDDRLKIQTLWQQLNRPLSEGPLKLRWSTLQAKTLLSKQEPAYQALVKAMQTGASVADCTAEIESHRELVLSDTE
ncbi:MAG: ATP-dependent Zn protease [Cyanobacteria bacterium P01_A01_bin.105]